MSKQELCSAAQQFKQLGLVLSGKGPFWEQLHKGGKQLLVQMFLL